MSDLKLVLALIDRFGGCVDSDDELAIIHALGEWADNVRSKLASPSDAGEAGDLPRRLDELREAGWSVAVHNDYKQNGAAKTFWLLTHADGRWIKGEGGSDSEALEEAFQLSLAAGNDMINSVVRQRDVAFELARGVFRVMAHGTDWEAPDGSRMSHPQLIGNAALACLDRLKKKGSL